LRAGVQLRITDLPPLVFSLLAAAANAPDDSNL
jgi:hypothetical protein